MVNGEAILDGEAKEPCCCLVAEWLDDVYSQISEEVGRNSWRKMAFKWL